MLLVHPGGPFWARRDEGAWSIPKGECEPGEDALQAARREFSEETGFELSAALLALTPVRQSGGKRVCAWAAEGDAQPEQLRSNRFRLEWPPGSGRLREFPEIDRAQWFTLAQARFKLVAGQRPLLDELAQRLAGGSSAPG